MDDAAAVLKLVLSWFPVHGRWAVGLSRLSLPGFILPIFTWSLLFSGSFIVIIQNMNRSESPLSYECNQF